MKVIFKESKFNNLILKEALNEFDYADGSADHNPYDKKITARKDLLNKFVDENGYVMTSRENGRDYVVYELYTLSDMLGFRYCLCRIINDGEPYGTVAIKPMDMFKEKVY